MLNIERVMNDTPRPASEQSQTTGFKRRDFTPPISSSEGRKEWVIIRAINFRGSVGGQTCQGASVIEGSIE